MPRICPGWEAGGYDLKPATLAPNLSVADWTLFPGELYLVS
jgi:hypothetical protein